MIKYSQGEIIIDVTNLNDLSDDGNIDLTEVLKDFIKENYNEEDGEFIPAKVLRKPLVIIFKYNDAFYRVMFNVLYDSNTELRGFITEKNTNYSYYISVIGSSVLLKCEETYLQLEE